MMGYMYIVLSVLCGFLLCSTFLPGLKKTAGECSLPAFLLELPAWYVSGTLLLTWGVYLVSLLFQHTETPMVYGNVIVLSAAALWLLGTALWKRKKNPAKTVEKADAQKVSVDKTAAVKAVSRKFFLGNPENRKENYGLLLYVVITAAFVVFLMFLTFHVKDGSTYVGFSVFSDFAPHLGMIRSFSAGTNFPTQYAHFAGEDIRYHFMFQFLAGNLEFLGMRLDFAFNLPSIFGMVSVYFLLFALVVRITRSRLCGYLTAFLFTFRSSFTLFRYMAEQRKGNVLTALLQNTEFLGYTQNENWGLWNLNVYCNQRHLAFALAVLLLALFVFYPYMEQMGAKLLRLEGAESGGFSLRLKQLKELFFSKTAFGVQNVPFAVFMGIFLGAMAFWNGSALIATLAMLFFMAAVSDYRLDYLITALIALALSLLQSSLFVEGSAVAPAYFFGFLAENKTFWGVALFIVELTGIVLFVALLGAFFVRGVKRYMLLVFSVPFVLAFTLSLTGDITVNHKWIMMSLMLLSMFAAIFLAKLLQAKDWLKKCVAVVLLVVLTATGIYDLTTVVKRNQNYMIYAEDDPVTNWIMDNTTSKDIFLTPYYSLHRVVMGGAMLYYGWPYYAWSAGYDTDTRAQNVREMYEAASVEELKELTEEFNIRYIVVDYDCRTSTEYEVREDIIEAAYETVFEQDTGEWAFRIFDTTKER